MMRWVILTICLGLARLSFATDYYVGGASASDSNPGTAAQPFATIQKAASVARAGDVVNIRAGVYRETVIPANSGSGGSPIIFQPDGNAVVTISGADLADGGWSVHSGNIYKKSISLPANGYSEQISNNTTLVANQVFVGGKMMIDARWPNLPNSDDLFNRNDFRDARSGSGVGWSDRTVNDGSIPNIAGGWVGGTIWANGWFISNSAVITGQNGSQLTFNEDIYNKFRDFYYLTGRLGALDVEKEWFYDGNTSTLYLYQPGGGTPSNVEVKKRNWSFDLSNRSNITIRNINTFACAIMTNSNSPNITIDGLKAKYISHSVKIAGSYLQHSHIDDTGIRLVGDNSRIQNSVVEYSSDQGIVIGNNGVATNNLIHDISYAGAYPSAIYPISGTNNQKITYNTIYRTGRSAIDMWHQQNMDISYNDISQYGCINIDLGAIYGSVYGNLTGTRIHHNWIHDTRALVQMEGIQTAIYFDQASGPCTVDHNVMWNNGVADVYNQQNTSQRNAGSSWFYNNTFASTQDHSYVTYVSSPADVMRNNIYRQDLVFNNGSGQSNVLSMLLEGINPQFTGTGQGGLVYQLKSTSPAINAGIVIAGITDGSVGAPDIGAYEFGGTAWTAGYTAQPTNQVPNTPPTVTVTDPTNNATFKVGAATTIFANASDANGTITRVEFFYGTTKLGEDLTGPYSYNWSNLPVGTYAITAKATDNEGAVTTSAPVTIIVTANAAPTIQLTSPASNANFTAGSAISMTATATDNDGSVSKVEFFQGTTKLGEDTSGPYTFDWTNVPAGTYTLTAKATDNQNGSTSTTAITITVTAVNTPPTVVVTSPAANTSFTSGATITITAAASDNGSVAKVEFFQGTTKLGEDTSGPYSFTWTGVALGSYSITAKATDDQGLVTTSVAIPITVVATNTAPAVSVTAPATNSSSTVGSPINITATATDNVSVSNVEFFAGTTKLGEDASSPYAFTWSNAAVGTYSITAKATDDQGLVATSAAVTITVVAANTPPVVSITAPATNSSSTVGSPVTIVTTATDNGSVSKVEFFAGTTKLGEDTSSPFAFTWSNAAAGTYSITAKATDDQGLVATSAAITITVVAANTPPVVSITSPATNSSFTVGSPVNLTATATDNGSVSKVEFFAGTTKLGEDTSSPFAFTWGNAAVGTYSITAKATDNLGLVTTSAAITITVVTANTPPVVSITAPATNSSFTYGPPVNITATATDNGSVSKVEFFAGTTKLGEDTSSPFEFKWNSAAIGTYSITAKATDNLGLTTTSAAIQITIRANKAPVIAVTGPGANSTFTTGSSMTIAAAASDDDGSVTKVEFYQGATKLGEDATSPYSFNWANVPTGVYSITAKATDNLSLTKTSAAVPVTVVAANTPPIVRITGPANNSSFVVNSTIPIEATATDNGSVSKVEFFQGATKLGEDASSPYSFSWSDVPAGTYAITAKATDNAGLTATSPIVTVTVAAEVIVTPEPEPGVDIVPVAYAGEDMDMTLPLSSLALTGTATMDGTPITAEYIWVLVSGPSTIIMSDPAAPTLELTNLSEGTYVFELTVTAENGRTSTDGVTITINAPVQAELQGNIPRFFTPNGDGVDDVWAWTEPESFDVISVAVFNRAGEKLYETTSYQNNWDGRINGTLLQRGDYYYVVKLNGQPELKGAIQIIY